MKYAFVNQQRTRYPVIVPCRVLEVSSAGFYEYRKRLKKPRADKDAALREDLRTLHRSSRGTYGRPRLLLTAGDHPARPGSEASFAALCGTSPIPASSGKVSRHRLNRGGDRAANSALHIIAIGRLRTDPWTKAYVQKRIAEGHSKLEAIRCPKRYIAREVFFLLKARNGADQPVASCRLTLRRASAAANTPAPTSPAPTSPAPSLHPASCPA